MEETTVNSGKMKKEGHEASCVSGFLSFIFENKWFNLVMSYVALVMLLAYFAAMVYTCENNMDFPGSGVWCPEVMVLDANNEIIFSFE